MGSLACTSGELRVVGVVLRAACGRRVHASGYAALRVLSAGFTHVVLGRRAQGRAVGTHIEMMMRALVN